jgi:hypothetical protein
VSLADALQATKKLQRGPRCSVSKLLDRLDPDDADTLRDTLTDRGDYTWQQIAEAIKTATGEQFAGQTLARHASGKCCQQ